MRLANMDQTPVVFARDRIEITLAQKTLALASGVHQLVDGVGIGAIFSVIELDGTRVLLASLKGFHFLVAAQIRSNSGRGNRQGQQNEKEHDEHCEQDETVLMLSVFSRASRLKRHVFSLLQR
jgi:hypothetical protein